MEGAACWQAVQEGRAEPDDWFTGSQQGRARALAICALCPLRTDCFAWSVRNVELYREGGGLYGIWGGVSELERRRLVNRRRAVA